MISNVQSTVAPRYEQRGCPLVDDSSKYRRERISAAVLLIGFIAYSVFLVVATHLPQVHARTRPGVDKWLPFGLRMSNSPCNGYSIFYEPPSTSIRLVLIIALAAFGAADEITQPMFHRQAEFFDWLADCAGIVLGGCAVYLFVRSCNKKDI